MKNEYKKKTRKMERLIALDKEFCDFNILEELRGPVTILTCSYLFILNSVGPLQT